MKICHMTSAHDSDDIRIFKKECVSLAQIEGFEVFLVARGESRTEENVKVVGVGNPPSSRIKRMMFFSKKIYEKAREIDADVYHFHDPELLQYGLKLKKQGKHVVFDSHEETASQILIKPYLPKPCRAIVAKIYRIREKSICRKIDAVVFPALKEEESPFYGIAKKHILVDNLPKLSEFAYEPNQEKDRICCCIGTLSKERGITEMLEAAKKIDGKMILAGGFNPPEYEDELRKQGLLDNVDYRGIVGRDEVVSIYSEASVGISTLKHVGQYDGSTNFGTKEYEYMAMGLAVVRTDFEKIRELSDEIDFGIAVNPDKPDEISDAVNFLFDNPKILNAKGANGRKTVINRFNWETEVKKIIDLYCSFT